MNEAHDRPRGSRGLLSSTDVGTTNRARLLQALVDQGPLSRADLARLIRVPRATVGTIVNGLLAADVLEEDEPQAPADGIGKPSRPLWFGRDAALCGAISIDAGSVEVAVVDARGEIRARAAEALPVGASAAKIERQVVAAAQAVLGPHAGRLTGIGLLAPALCDHEASEVVACTVVPGLVGTRLPALLSDALGSPVLLEQDVRALAVGERWFGAARGREDFAALQLGVGVGAGIVLTGHLLDGRGGYTAQLGHTCVDVNGAQCSCGLRGCWETIASTRWLRAESARRGITGGRSTTPRRLARRAEAGDLAAGRLMADYTDNLSVGIASLVQLLSLQLFILHGDVVHAGEPMRQRLEQRVIERSLPALGDGVRIVFSELDQDSGLLGAAALVLTRHFGINV